MQLNGVLSEALAQVAWRRNVALEPLQAALEHESAEELAAVLGLEKAVAHQHMARIQRAVTVEADAGAGCQLLTNAIQAEVLAALSRL